MYFASMGVLLLLGANATTQKKILAEVRADTGTHCQGDRGRRAAHRSRQERDPHMSDLDTAAPGADTGAATTSKGTDAPSREGGAPATTDRALVTTDTDDVGDDGDNSDLFPAGGDTDAVENDSEQAPGGERQDDAALPAWRWTGDRQVGSAIS
jgi:hypothetical protein